MSAERRVRVGPLPPWLDARRLLGEQTFVLSAEPGGRLVAEGLLDTAAAADLAARLRGVSLGGQRVKLTVEPALPRRALREALRNEARRMRQGGEGFTRPGVRLDEEGRRSLTPEALALSLGKRFAGARVIDACAGAGGNAIGFARAGCRVTAIECSARRLELARHNARVYGVEQGIEFVHGDAVERVPQLQADVLFVDPPWGDYDRQRVELAQLPPLPALWAQRERLRVLAKLPPAFDPQSVSGGRVSAVFGSGRGDCHRVKFLLLESA